MILIVNTMFFLFISAQSSDANSRPTVETTIGKIIGTVKEVDVFGKIKKVENYFGIPYAEPPVGELRFKKPEPKRPLTSPLNATKHGNICLQMHILPIKALAMSENCLFLNVYVPADRDEPLAVMVFFHGGIFVTGASDWYVSNTLSAYGGLIVVTVNYRLSVLGFLSTQDKFAPGNYGLWDQQLAIKWVHENIHAFGGDPNNVALVGQSAGAISVLMQSIFEGNYGLFQRIILQSGGMTPRPLNFDFATPKKDAQELGRLFDCKGKGSKKLIRCLREVPFEQLVKKINSFPGFFKFPLPFIVNVADGEFLKDDFNDILRGNSVLSTPGRSLFSSLDMISGITKNEGCSMMGPAGASDPENFAPNRTQYENILIPFALSKAFGNDVSELVKCIVLQEYTDWTNPEEIVKIRNKLVAFWTDFFFAEPALETTKLHALSAESGAKTYLYEFDVLASAHPWPAPSWCDRASHGDELLYLFFEQTGGLMTFVPGHEDFLPEVWEREVAENIMTIWSNFAKTG